MIGSIRGKLIDKNSNLVLVETQGLGYEIAIPLTTFCQLPAIESPIFLWLHLVVREDCQQLYGFVADSDRALFRALIKVSGVGPKLALAILSGMDANHFVHCLQQRDSKQLVAIPGLGKKTAERLIIELSDKLSNKLNFDSTFVKADANSPAKADAISALISLGYKALDASRIINKLQDLDQSSETLIKQALKELAST